MGTAVAGGCAGARMSRTPHFPRCEHLRCDTERMYAWARNAVAVVGALLQASAYGVPQMLVGRVCTGFAIGSISSSVPAYLNECGSKVHDRGPANAINAALLLGGVPLGYCTYAPPFVLLDEPKD